MEYFKNRRTIRQYSDRPVPDSLVEEIVEQAAKAPTCGTMQLYSIISTRSQEMKDVIAPLHFNQPCIRQAPVVLTVCADYFRFTRWCEISGAKPGYDNFLSFLSAMADATIIAQQIVTIAEMKGLGTCYLGTVLYNAPEISKALHLPEMVVPVACITLGYPNEKGIETERLPVEGILYKEHYPEWKDEEVMDIFKVKDEWEANKKYVEENGKNSLAEVFTDIRYTKPMNEEISEKLLEFLQKQKFLK